MVGSLLLNSAVVSVLSPGVWNVWLRLAASGRRLAGVWQASGRLDVWASGARLGTSGASGLVPCAHNVWARLGTSGHVWARLDVWRRLERLVRLVRHHDHFT